MKKIISLILVLTMIFGITSVLSGCKKRVKGGTEAAKLLLANERLDENVVKGKIDLGLDKFIADASAENIESLNKYYGRGDGHTPLYTWSDFPASNDTLDQFGSFVINIEHEAAEVAEDIVNMKNNVGIVDKWVKVGRELQMLRVYENSDVLIVKGIYDDIHVYYRYTDSDAKNVYEMYSFMIYDDGTTGEIRTVYIPGNRYEYHYINSDGFEDYVIMENSRGYWMCTRYGYFYDNGKDHAIFTPLVIKDGLCYATNISIESGTAGIKKNGSTLVDIASGRELLGVGMIDNGSYGFSLPLSSVKSGFQVVGSDEAVVDGSIILSSTINYFRTDKGGYLNSDTDPKNEDYSFLGGYVNYDYSKEIYKGALEFESTKSDLSFEESISGFSKYIDDLGITLYRGINEIADAFNHAFLLADNFGDSFEWNGYNMNSIANVMAARNSLKSDFRDARAEYDKVKDNETVIFKQKLAANVDFADVSILNMDANSYNNGVITIGGISVQINDTVLFESGEKYTLKVALSLCDENGNPISVNTVPLVNSAEQAVSFNGGAVELSAFGSFAVPKNLTQGDYALVIYGATADEGIRVTDMVKVGSFSTYNEAFESAAMDIRVTNVQDTLHIRYTIKNSHDLAFTATKDSYTVAELERIIITEVLKYGAPFSNAVIEYADGGAVEDRASLGKGRYRMMCYLNTSDGLAQSYIYLEVK